MSCWNLVGFPYKAAFVENNYLATVELQMAFKTNGLQKHILVRPPELVPMSD